MVGKWLKTASVTTNFLWKGRFPGRQQFISQVKKWSVKPDLFTFAQKVNDLTPRFGYTLNAKIWPSFRSRRTRTGLKTRLGGVRE